MATERIKSVGSGKDYATPALWFAGEVADLVTLDEVRIAELYESFLSVATIAVSNSWVTDQTRYFELRAHASKKHNGVKGAGIVIKATTANNSFLSDSNAAGKSFNIKDLEFDTTRIFYANLGGSFYNNVERVIAYGLTNANRYLHSYSRYGFALNCLFLDNAGAAYLDYATNFKFVNCTFYNCNSGSLSAGGLEFGNYQRTRVKNCAVMGCAVKDISHHTRTQPGTYPKNNCSSDDSVEYHSNSKINKTASNQFKNIAGNDFDVKVGSDLINAGIGSGSDAEVPLTDIAGRTRSTTTPTIGAFEYLPSGDLAAILRGVGRGIMRGGR